MGKDAKEIFEIEPILYKGSTLTERQIIDWFKRCDAFWMYEGEPTADKPHAKLRSGLCSNGFFDCSRVLCYPNLTKILADRLVSKLFQSGKVSSEQVDWVIGSPYAAITFSYEVAALLKAVHAFTEKNPDDLEKKGMLWKRMEIPSGANIFQIEELITTSGTFKEIRRAIAEGNKSPVNFLPVVGALVHRPPKLSVDYGNIEVIALVEKEIWAVKPEKCHLCKAGSKPVSPKTHWEELAGIA